MPEDYNFWQQDVLPFEERATYYSAEPFGAGTSAASPFGGGYSPASQQYWSGQYGNVMNQYMGTVGKSLREGEFPSLTFTDYLGQYPWTERYTALSPSMRQGGGISRFAPSVRRMY